MDFSGSIRFNGADKPVGTELMKKLILTLLLLSSPLMCMSSSAQTRLTPKMAVTARADNCAPIGRTAKGELVYSMKCDNVPAPPPSPQAEVNEAPSAPPPPPESRSTGLFGMSYDRRPDQ
jgi:hypothetical protein